MKQIIKSKSFILGCVFGFLIILGWSFIIDKLYPERMCFDCYIESGFPFVSHKWGTVAHLDQIVWEGLFGNILVLILFCFGMGLLVNFMASKFTGK